MVHQVPVLYRVYSLSANGFSQPIQQQKMSYKSALVESQQKRRQALHLLNAGTDHHSLDQ